MLIARFTADLDTLRYDTLQAAASEKAFAWIENRAYAYLPGDDAVLPHNRRDSDD